MSSVGSAARQIRSGRDHLTPKEIEVLQGVSRCGGVTAAAKELNMSRGTTAVHMQSVSLKFGVHTWRDAVVIGVERGYVQDRRGT